MGCRSLALSVKLIGPKDQCIWESFLKRGFLMLWLAVWSWKLTPFLPVFLTRGRFFQKWNFKIELISSERLIGRFYFNKTESKFRPRSQAKPLFKFIKLFKLFKPFNLIQFLTFLAQSKITICMKSIYFYLCRKINYAQNQFIFENGKSIYICRKQKINQFIQD